MGSLKAPYFKGICYQAFTLLAVVFLISSCAPSKKVTYFQDVPLAQQATEGNRQAFTEPRLRPNDLVSVSIQTLEPQSPVAGTGGSSSSASTSSTATTGYMIGADGNADLPLVGKTQLAGLTTSEAKEAIRKKAQQYFKDPIVNVKYTNFTVMVLGEVNNPGPVNVANEKISIVDAIGLASDMTIFGKRENVLLVREENGKNVYVRFDLNSSKTFESPYFYLKSGDMIYVEPNNIKKKGATVDTSRERYIGYAVSAISLLLSIYAIFRLK
jgi:polysaccharide export outer membrane protein